MKTIEITINYLIENFSGNVSDAITFIRNSYPTVVERPNRPILQSKHTSQDAIDYAQKLAVYENVVSQYNTDATTRQNVINQLDSVLVEFMKDQAGLMNIPEQYRDKVYYKAYQDGHAYGCTEIYSKLCDLIEIFE